MRCDIARHDAVSLGDFRTAFALVALVTLISVAGDLKLPLDTGSRIGGGGNASSPVQRETAR